MRERGAVRRAVVVGALAVSLALGALAGAGRAGAQDEAEQTPAGAAASAPAANASAFTFVDVVLDTGGRPLAAWQVRLRATTRGVSIVGVEGGDEAARGAFGAAPFYDPEAMSRDEVIVAAYSTARAEALPRGRVRVARVHVLVEGGGAAAFGAEVMAAADGAGVEFEPGVEVGGPEGQ